MNIISRWIALFLLLFSHLVSAFQAERAIVFIHIGKEIPDYAATAISQARLFNEECNIILIANEEALATFPKKKMDPKLIVVTCESLVKTEEHLKFIRERPHSEFRDGFWNHTSERFLYLYDLFCQYEIQNVFHLEYDNMLYANVDELLPIMKTCYTGIAATFDNDQRCIPGFIYIPNKEVMGNLASFFASHASKNYNDMECIALFKETYPNLIDNLPIIMSSYVKNHSLISALGHTVKDASRFSNHLESFQSIFDAAAIGQYLGGCDPRLGYFPPGFINERCVFNASYLSYEWDLDERDRRVPFAIYDNKRYRINNLHIHSKKLWIFLSDMNIWVENTN